MRFAPPPQLGICLNNFFIYRIKILTMFSIFFCAKDQLLVQGSDNTQEKGRNCMNQVHQEHPETETETEESSE